MLLERVQHLFTRMFSHLRQFDYSTRLVFGPWKSEEIELTLLKLVMVNDAIRYSTLGIKSQKCWFRGAVR